MVVIGPISTPENAHSSARQRERQRAGEVGRNADQPRADAIDARSRAAPCRRACGRRTVRARRSARRWCATTSRLCTLMFMPPTVEGRRRECRRARAFGAEEPQAEPGQREMHRDRDDQQHEHAGFGERLVGDPIEQRSQRRHSASVSTHLRRRTAAAAAPATQPAARDRAAGTPRPAAASRRGSRRAFAAPHARPTPPSRRRRRPCRSGA